jgi:hypothetical protein
MTAFPAGAHLSVGQTRRARREVAAYRVEVACMGDSVRVPWVVITLGIALLMLALADVVWTVAELV